MTSNPCRICLVRPNCSEQCGRFREYAHRQDERIEIQWLIRITIFFFGCIGIMTFIIPLY
jgi:hypothetical protein